RLGTGLSDRDRPPDTFTLDAEVETVAAIVDELALRRASLFGFSFGGVVSAAFAARRPERVSRLLLFAAHAVSPIATARAMVALTELVRADWQLGARLLTEALYPDAERDALNAQAEMRRSACTGEMAAALLELSSRTDIRDELGASLAPTLVMHRTEDQMVPFALGRELAALIPGARLEKLDGRWHQPWYGDADAVFDAAGRFLGVPLRRPATDVPSEPVALTARETEVLRLVADGLGDAEVAARLVLSPHTVHRHVANIRMRLSRGSRAAAAAHAARLGLI